MQAVKRITGRVALLALWITAICVCLPGCASGPTAEQEGAARLIVRGATLAYIEQVNVAERAAVAARVLDITAEVAKVATGEPITLQRLAELAAGRLPADMSAPRRLLAMELIEAAAGALQRRTGVGGLESDTLLYLPEVLRWIDSVARFYVSES